MKAVRAIVVATDFSENAARAARRGALLADARGLPLVLLHVVSATVLEAARAWFRDRSDVTERLALDAQQLLDAAAGTLAASGRTVSTRLVVGDVPAELAARSKPDVLLVIGARGEMTAGDVVLGSTAERVVRAAEGPVLVVRSEAAGAYRAVVAGLDLESGCDALLQDIRDFAPAARVIGFNAYRVPMEGALLRAGVPRDELERHRGEALQAALAGIERLGHPVVPAAEHGDAAGLLIAHGQRTGADLVAVARRSRSAVASLLIGSVARRVVAEADRDVLVLRGP